MICACGYVDMALNPHMLNISVGMGVVTVRPVGTGVRVEHLNCGRCIGFALRPGVSPAFDCGCQDKTAVVTSADPNAVSSSVFSRSGVCTCGAMTWEDARDGALILEGVGDFQVWDREGDGAAVVVAVRCLVCGIHELVQAAAPVSGRA